MKLYPQNGDRVVVSDFVTSCLMLPVSGVMKNNNNKWAGTERQNSTSAIRYPTCAVRHQIHVNIEHLQQPSCDILITGMTDAIALRSAVACGKKDAPCNRRQGGFLSMHERVIWTHAAPLRHRRERPLGITRRMTDSPGKSRLADRSVCLMGQLADSQLAELRTAGSWIGR